MFSDFFYGNWCWFYYLFQFLLLVWNNINAARDSTKETIIFGQSRIIELTRMFPTLLPVYYVECFLIINVYICIVFVAKIERIVLPSTYTSIMPLSSAAVYCTRIVYAYGIVVRSAGHAGQQSAAVWCCRLPVRTGSRSTSDTKPFFHLLLSRKPFLVVFRHLRCGTSGAGHSQTAEMAEPSANSTAGSQFREKALA